MDNQQENLSFHHARLHIFRLHLLFQPIGFGGNAFHAGGFQSEHIAVN